MLDPNVATVIMGVVNVTPDSFSDGGRFADADEAIEAGIRQHTDGAHLVDVGGESTRPGAKPMIAVQELKRVIPVIEGLSAAGVHVSVDTSKPDVAEVAIDAGAVVVNDVSGLRADGMARLCADAGVGVVVMHMPGDPRTMQNDPTYDDVVDDVHSYLRDRLVAIRAAGVRQDQIAIDPGIGFGKTLSHNLQLLNRVGEFTDLDQPVLIGASRKSFLGTLTGRAVLERDVVTAASAALAVTAGASIIRVHNVPFAADAIALADAMVRTRDEGRS